MKSASVGWLRPSAVRSRLFFFPFFRSLLAPEKGRVDCTSASPPADSPELDESSGLSTYSRSLASPALSSRLGCCLFSAGRCAPRAVFFFCGISAARGSESGHAEDQMHLRVHRDGPRWVNRRLLMCPRWMGVVWARAIGQKWSIESARIASLRATARCSRRPARSNLAIRLQSLGAPDRSRWCGHRERRAAVSRGPCIPGARTQCEDAPLGRVHQ